MEGTTNFTAAPIDEFKVILGMEFLCSTNAVPTPRLEIASIMEEASPCMIPTERMESKVQAIAALQLKRGFKKKEITYPATLVNKSPQKWLFPLRLQMSSKISKT